ncbi:DeoR/GlpR family DNA-binding transcription regulator [Pseudoramibacter faecis]|uniref:DeoR/GlpR family DNA-binding transcription regulator n=1 Tax=Pseudoramibacter faecis TaxID=3108534 RepID=UPI002E777467|nr:DeoR/GlpR family DNA-binding transcription regulator [Pseudoramibacter sp. HA2172]
MLKSERQNIILDLICQQNNVRVSELKTLFEVSDETIRRDFSEMEKKGLLRVVHGGAVYDSPTTNEYQIDLRIKKNRQEKEAICSEAAKYIDDGMSVAIVSSTTTWPMGKFLTLKNRLTVVTNSIMLAQQIAKNKENRVILVGGVLWQEDQKLMGSATEDTFSQFNVDVVLFSAAGITVKQGITDYNETEVELTKTVLKTGRKIIMLNDFTKFGTVAFRKIADIGAVDTIITDWNVSAGDHTDITDLGIDIIRASKA